MRRVRGKEGEGCMEREDENGGEFTKGNMVELHFEAMYLSLGGRLKVRR